MKFIAEIHQGGGCDYTIGCGTVVKELQATTKEEAEKEITFMFANEDGDYYSHDFGKGDYIYIYEVVQRHTFDVEALKNKIRKQQNAERQKEEEIKERAEFERLNKKFAKK